MPGHHAARRDPERATHRFLGAPSGVGLVIANMIGAGVFVSAGFMVQDLGPGSVLLAWLTGGLLAMAGARAYAEVAVLVPRSGGEYRYLSELLHPAVGYLAGWASLLVGFSAPMAVSAYGAAAFASTVVGADEPRVGATLLIGALTLVHAVGLRSSRRAQNALVVVKGLVLLAFVAVGLSLGEHTWPTWSPEDSDAGGSTAFATALLFVAYSFSGWNAAAYAAEEFESPRRDVPRAMLLGCATVAVVYLLVNWVFVANLTAQEAAVARAYEETRVTLGHLIAEELVGASGSAVMSLGIAAVMASSTSAMLLVGPRVYAAMADDGFLPPALGSRPGTPPRGAVFLQGLLAVALLYLHTVGELLINVGAVLVLFSALVAASLFLIARRRPDLDAPGASALVAAAVYVAFSIWMLYQAFVGRTGLVIWLATAAAAALVGYRLTRRRSR